MGNLLAEIWNWLGANWEAIVASVALFIALWEAITSRRHNRLSVRPSLAFYRDTDIEKFTCRLVVGNNGVGPARLLRFTLLCDGAPLPDSRGPTVRDLLATMFPEVTHRCKVGYANNGHILAVNENFNIILLTLKGVTEQEAERLLERMNRIDCIVGYESFYGEKQTAQLSREI
jgi:hypothetical protein